ncbi:hypothetical protein AB0K00_41465 [Dactylosporangium sp. NPDC049525]|uniref:hypothetical protein n=1 Tax=Dactylosporangium sp. NPDC049525 TaxID=3154730 RepID=UPI00342E3BF1
MSRKPASAPPDSFAIIELYGVFGSFGLSTTARSRRCTAKGFLANAYAAVTAGQAVGYDRSPWRSSSG